MNKITEIRKNKKLSVSVLSKKSSLSIRTIQKIEKGEIKNPGVYTIKKIAQVLGVSIENLI